ncbi:unnamed protein product [Camellia sinensis]
MNHGTKTPGPCPFHLLSSVSAKLSNDNIGAMDRISELPDSIIHHMMSFLNRSDVTKTSVLSKRWHNLWASFPILNFDELHLEQRLNGNPESMCWTQEVFTDGFMKHIDDRETTNSIFFNHVDRSLSRFIENKIKIQKFKLVIRLVNSKSAVVLEKWLRMIIESNVEELDLWTYPEICVLYNLTPSIFDAKSMKALKLKDCNLGLPLCNETINFNSLQRLSLETLQIDEKVLQHFFSSCPLIEELVLIHCRGLNRFQVKCLHKLRKLTLVVKSRHPFNMVEIEAPSLEYFHYTNKKHSTYVKTFNMSRCQNLKHLSLCNTDIEEGLFHDLVSKFPLLEILELSCCDMLKSIKISSSHLKRFTLHFNVHDVEWFLKLRVFLSRALQFKVFTKNMSHNKDLCKELVHQEDIRC